MQDLIRIHNASALSFSVMYIGMAVGIVFIGLGFLMLYLGRK